MRRNQWIVLVMVAIVGLFVVACGSEPTPVPPTHTPTAVPPTNTATPVPPTATPTPTLTPTPTPPSAQALVEAAFDVLETESHHSEMDMQMTVKEGTMTMEVSFTFVGDFQPPDHVQATVSMSYFGITVEMEMIAIGETVYGTNLDTGEWEISAEDEFPLTPQDLTAVDPGDIEELTLVGEETLDGTAVYHLTGISSAEDLGDALAGLEGELQLEYWIGVADGRLRQNRVEGELLAPGEAGTIGLAATTTYSDYGRRVSIEPPELPTPIPVATFAAAAATPAPPVPEAMGQLEPGWTAYLTEAELADGLPPDVVLKGLFWTDAAVAADGALWFTTLGGGVFRFDGEAWTHYSEEDGLASDIVLSITEGRGPLGGTGGMLWFATAEGICRFDGESWTSYPESAYLASGPGPTAFAPDGALWYGTAKGATRFDGETWTTYTAEDGLASNYVLDIVVDPNGALWFATNGGVTRLDDETWTTYTILDGLAHNRVTSAALAAPPPGGTGSALWFGTDGGVSRFDGETWTSYTTADGLAVNEVNAVEAAGGVVWFATQGGGVSRFDGETWTTYTTADGLLNDAVGAIEVAPDGALWFGTEEGLSRFTGQEPDTGGRSWTTYTQEDGLVSDRVSVIGVDGEGALWFGTEEGLSRFDPLTEGEAWTTYTVEDGLADDNIWSIAMDGEGDLWFGTGGGGVSRFDGQTWTTYTALNGLANDWVPVITMDEEGTLWFGTDGGVSRFDPFTEGWAWTTFTEEDGLVNNRVQAIAVDGEGALWFGTWNRYASAVDVGVSRFDPHIEGGAWTTYTTEDGLVDNTVWDIVKDGEDALWFGTSGGISRFDPHTEGEAWTTYTTEDPLAGDWVSAIKIDEEGVLWFGRGSGVSRFDGQTWTTYTTDDGLVHDVVLAIAVDGEGALWFGTEAGVSRYVPSGGPTPTSTPSSSQSTAQLKVGLVTDVNGIDDAGWNQNTWAGLQRAQEGLGVQAQFIESQTQADYESNISEFAEQDYDLIVTASFLLGDATARMALVYPNTSMAIVDFAYDPPIPNVAGMVFNVDEAAFPVGYLAAGWADLQDPDDPQVGWIGGMQLPPVEQFVVAYEAGVDYYNQQTGSSVQAKGVYVGDFRAPERGKLEGQSLIDQGVDVIFGVGGTTGNGGLVAAKENGKWGIGVDVDQYYTLPNERDILITSCVKRLDNAAFGVIELLANGEFPGGGLYVGTLSNDGVGLAPYHDFEDQIPDELKQGVQAVIEGIKKGEIDTGW